MRHYNNSGYSSCSVPYAYAHLALAPQVFEALWTPVAQKCPDLAEEACTIVEFQRVVNNHQHAEDIQASLGAV